MISLKINIMQDREIKMPISFFAQAYEINSGDLLSLVTFCCVQALILIVPNVYN